MHPDLLPLFGLITQRDDFPKPGDSLRDIGPALAAPRALALITTAIADAAQNLEPTAVAGLEARGFLLAGALAERMSISLTMIRKANCLPPPTLSIPYQSEYGAGTFELRRDHLPPDASVLLADDFLATGGSLAAARALIESAEARVVGAAVIAESVGMQGRSRLGSLPVIAAFSFSRTV